MRTHKRKKNSRQRGSGGHGWGAKKKHRGSGNRGGTGNAGSGKRGASKRVRFVREHFGKHGFLMRNPVHISAVTLQYLEDSAAQLIHEGKAKEVAGAVELDLGAIGIQKLLSKGLPSRKFKLTVQQATPNAVKKIEAAGGSVTVQRAE